jgi:siderophore synthetase component
MSKAILPPLVDYGIGVEAHGQNLVARICRETGEVKGFAVRDFGGIRLYVPTLKKGVDFSSIPSGSAVMTDDLHNIWSKVHHAAVQNHIGSLLSALGLDKPSGWTIVRDTLSTVLKPDKSALGKQLYDFFLGATMLFKCFLRMRMEGKYRDISDL